MTLLEIAASILALTGCTPSETGSDTTTLTVWHYYNTDGQVEALEKLADSFEAEHPGVTVQYEYVPVDQFTTALR